MIHVEQPTHSSNCRNLSQNKNDLSENKTGAVWRVQTCKEKQF